MMIHLQLGLPGTCVLVAALSLSTGVRAQSSVWLRQFGTNSSDAANGFAPDGAGGVYSAGDTWGSLAGPSSGRSDVWITRHDAAGNRAWIRQFGTTEWDVPGAVAGADGGGVYVGGQTFGVLDGFNAGIWDAFLARYDGVGNRMWIRQFGSSATEGVLTLVPDGADGVFLGGSTSGAVGGPNGGWNDVWFARYDGAGSRLWLVQIPGADDERCTAGATDLAGGFYLAGDTSRPSAGAPIHPDAWVARFDGTGNELWRRQLGTGLPDSASALASDGSGGVYVTGSTYSALGAPTAGELDAWVARYDASGNQLWIRQFGTAEHEIVFCAAPDGSGGVYVGGETVGALSGPNAGASDIFLARYDGVGSQVSLVQFGNAMHNHSGAAAPDGLGGVFLGGYTEGNLGGPSAGGIDAWIARFDGLEPSTYCVQTAPNSTSQTSTLVANGSALAAANQLVLTAERLPLHTLGLFLVSRTQGLSVMPAGSQGDLCVAGNVGRFLAPGQVASSGAAGRLDLSVDLTALPMPSGPVAAAPGETWNFQAWHRDANPGPTSNFTDAVSIRFR